MSTSTIHDSYLLDLSGISSRQCAHGSGRSKKTVGITHTGNMRVCSPPVDSTTVSDLVERDTGVGGVTTDSVGIGPAIDRQRRNIISNSVM